MDKVNILNQITEQDIFLRFLNLSDFPKGNISSPFTSDSNPSFKLYENNTFKCHSSGNQGDVWQFVAYLHNLDCKRDFNKVLNIVADEFGIIDETKHFNFTTKDFTKEHYKFWLQGNWRVTSDILELYRVSALDKYEVWNNKDQKIDKKKIFPSVIAFVYTTDTGAELYVPKQDKANKFLMNKTSSDDIFGYSQLSNDLDYLVICAGKKDCLILNANGIPAVCFRSENHNPTQEQISRLQSKSKRLMICYDNDLSGQNAMIQLAKKYHLSQIVLPSQYNDIADYFQVYTDIDFKKIIDEVIEVSEAHEEEIDGSTIFHVTETYLNKFYKFRYNTISLDIEICKKGFNSWSSLNENSLFIELQKKGIKVSINNLISILKSDFVPHYNPLKEYFQNLPKWDKKTDYIQLLANHVQAIDKEQFIYHFKKWFVRTVKCALIEDYFNKQAFILVHKGQNSGKTTFCRFLCPPILSQYIAEDISNDKDARVLLCKNFLINLDELAILSRKEINNLKSFFSKTQINERLPYDRKNTILPRVASFIGSTNQDSFLNDETGSVRWLCFTITGIDWNYAKTINIDLVWSQAYALSQDKNFESELTLDDIQRNEDRNKKFQILSTEQEILSKYILHSDSTHGEFMTATDILVYLNPLGIKLNQVQIGKALNSLGFEKIKNSKTQTYGYYVTCKPLFDKNPINGIYEVSKYN